jgi:DNA-binding XRE family transcriptional regulator
MAKAATVSAVRKKEQQPAPALDKLKKWMKREAFDTSKLSRRLDIAWDTMRRIEVGESEPGITVALLIRDLSDGVVDLDSWRAE